MKNKIENKSAKTCDININFGLKAFTQIGTINSETLSKKTIRELSEIARDKNGNGLIGFFNSVVYIEDLTNSDNPELSELRNQMLKKGLCYLFLEE